MCSVLTSEASVGSLVASQQNYAGVSANFYFLAKHIVVIIIKIMNNIIIIIIVIIIIFAL